MISLTRLNGTPVSVNENNILWVEALPDTSVMLLGGDRLIVKQSVDEVCALAEQSLRARLGHPQPAPLGDLATSESEVS